MCHFVLENYYCCLFYVLKAKPTDRFIQYLFKDWKGCTAAFMPAQTVPNHRDIILLHLQGMTFNVVLRSTIVEKIPTWGVLWALQWTSYFIMFLCFSAALLCQPCSASSCAWQRKRTVSPDSIITATNSLLCIHQFFEKYLTVKVSKSFSLLWPLTFCFHIVRKVCSPESQFLKTE